MISQDPGPTRWLRLVALVVLVAGIVGGIALLAESAALGIAVAIHGVVVWGSLMVLASIGENIALIASHLGTPDTDED